MNHTPNYKNSFRILKGGKISLVVSAFLSSTTLTFAAPSGGTVTSGNANISQAGKVTNITQSSNKASINWNKFNVASDETVNFKQPNASSITLNRVIGNEKSIINGALNANGQVWILNSNGVLFGKNASINTSGLLASTKELSDTDFQAGNYNFKGNSKESVINLGTIDVVNGGSVILAANEVRNEGTIKAIKGKIHLVGANEYTVNLNGNSLVNLSVNKGVLDALVQNSGTIIANGGEVYLTTNAVNELLKGVVNNTGVIEANSMDELFGKVELFAHGGEVQVGGTLEAKDGFIETSGKDFKILENATVKAGEWLIDPVDITIDATLASTIVTALGSGDVTIKTDSPNTSTNVSVPAENQTSTDGDTTDGDIYVNSNIIWSTDKKLTLNATDAIYVNATIQNTNTTDGGVFFNAANTNDKVIFNATTGKVIIHNINQLQWMNTALVGNYELGSNIDATVTSGWNTSKGWLPIGVDWNPFKGKFDGLGHTISNLKINDNTKFNVGLFGATNGATIQNIGLIDVDITGAGIIGALVGYSDAGSTIKNSYATGKVTGTNYLGGLVGCNMGSSTIENSYATVKVIGTTNIIGGLVGRNNASTIKNSYATGAVSGNKYVGGLVGYNESSSTIENSYATGKVVGTEFSKYEEEVLVVTKPETLGGLVGYNIGSSTIKNSYATGEVSGNIQVGGLVGWNTSAITTSYSNGKVTATTSHGGGLVGRNDVYEIGTTDAASFWDTEKSGQATSAGGGTGKTTKEMSYGGIYKAALWDIVADSSVTSTTPIIKYDGTKYVWAIAPLDLSYTLSTNQSKTYDGQTKNLSDLYTNVFGSTYSFINSEYKFQVGGNDVTGYKNAGIYNGIKVVSTNDFLTIKAYGSTDGKYVIDKANIASITGITASNKTYDGTTTATLVTTGAAFTDMISGDTLSVATSTGAFADKKAADGKAVSISGLTLGGADAGNYNLLLATATTATANISKANIASITGITAANKTYDGTTTATLVTTGAAFTDMISGDTLSVATSTGAFVDKEVADGKTVNITGLTLGGADVGNYNLLLATATTTANITAVVTPPSPEPIIPKPEPEPKTKVPEKIIRAAENSVIPPIVRLPNTNVPLASTSNLATGNTGSGSSVSVVSQPTNSQSSQSVSLGQLQQSQTQEAGSQGTADVRVPASENSRIILVNGGVNLPEGVEQEFYVSANQNNAATESKEK